MQIANSHKNVSTKSGGISKLPKQHCFRLVNVFLHVIGRRFRQGRKFDANWAHHGIAGGGKPA